MSLRTDMRALQWRDLTPPHKRRLCAQAAHKSRADNRVGGWKVSSVFGDSYYPLHWNQIPEGPDSIILLWGALGGLACNQGLGLDQCVSPLAWYRPPYLPPLFPLCKAMMLCCCDFVGIKVGNVSSTLECWYMSVHRVAYMLNKKSHRTKSCIHSELAESRKPKRG